MRLNIPKKVRAKPASRGQRVQSTGAHAVQVWQDLEVSISYFAKDCELATGGTYGNADARGLR